MNVSRLSGSFHQPVQLSLNFHLNYFPPAPPTSLALHLPQTLHTVCRAMTELVRSSSTTVSVPPDYQRAESGALTFSRVSSLPGDDVTAWLLEKFPTLPADDVVDASYSCALVKGILLQGRLYVTKSSLLFYAKIFGRVTKEHLPLKSIRSVQKRKSGFVANAIKVTFIDCNMPPMIFGSLNRRERACALIMNRLLAVNPSAEALREGEEDFSAEENDNSSNLSVSTSDEHFRSKSVPSSVAGSAFKLPSVNIDNGDNSDFDEGTSSTTAFARANTDGVSANRGSVMGSRTASRTGSSTGEGERGGEHIGTVDGIGPVEASPSVPPSRQRLWKVDEDPVDVFSGKEHGKRKEQARRLINSPVPVVFDLLFAGDFILRVHEKNGNTECSETEWTRGDDGFMTRTIRFSRALGYRIGPKATRVVETHRYSFTSDGGALVEFSGHNLDVPMGDSFRVESYIELKPAGDHGTATSAIASIAVHFSKSTMLRGKIESGALAETKATMTRLLELANEFVVEQLPTPDAPLSMSGRSDSLLSKRSSESLHLTTTDMLETTEAMPSSPPKRLRSEGLPVSLSSQRPPLPGKLPRADCGVEPGISLPPRSSAATVLSSVSSGERHARVVTQVSDDQVGVATYAKSRVGFGETDGWRIVTLVLLAVISVLLLVCIVLLIQLQRDIHRVEHLALLRQAERTAGELRSVCSSCSAGTDIALASD